MLDKKKKEIWVAVHVERGFVSEVQAFGEEAAARRRERTWRRGMNPDYDETAVCPVVVNAHGNSTCQRCN